MKHHPRMRTILALVTASLSGCATVPAVTFTYAEGKASVQIEAFLQK
jgi:type IV pilus biogenesis protein CpaD/CtpE